MAKEVRAYVLRCGFDSGVFIINGLVTFYSICDDNASMRAMFNRMSESDTVTWNLMIAGYSQGGFYEGCKGLYREMLNNSVLRSDGVVAVSVLQACGQSDDLVLGMEIYKFVTECQIKVDIWLCNASIGMYVVGVVWITQEHYYRRW